MIHTNFYEIKEGQDQNHCLVSNTLLVNQVSRTTYNQNITYRLLSNKYKKQPKKGLELNLVGLHSFLV